MRILIIVLALVSGAAATFAGAGLIAGQTPDNTDPFDLEALLQASEQATYKVTYRTEVSGTAAFGNFSTTRTDYRMGEDYHRSESVEDLLSGEPTIRITIKGEEFVCEPWDGNGEHQRICYSQRDFDEYWDQLKTSGEVIELSGSTITLTQLSPDEYEERISYYEREVAGVHATCTTMDYAGYSTDTCNSDEGVLLLVSTEGQDMIFREEAIEFSKDVTLSDFTLPYPLISAKESLTGEPD